MGVVVFVMTILWVYRTLKSDVVCKSYDCSNICVQPYTSKCIVKSESEICFLLAYVI